MLTTQNGSPPITNQGVLTLHIPIAERAKPRKVEVSAGAPEAVEVTASTAA